MTQTQTSLGFEQRSPAVPAALLPLHDAAVAEFSGARYHAAVPLLGRLALALPVGHGLRPAVRASVARALLELGKLRSARRELDLALSADPRNATFRALHRLLRRAEIQQGAGVPQ